MQIIKIYSVYLFLMLSSYAEESKITFNAVQAKHSGYKGIGHPYKKDENKRIHIFIDTAENRSVLKIASLIDSKLNLNKDIDYYIRIPSMFLSTVGIFDSMKISSCYGNCAYYDKVNNCLNIYYINLVSETNTEKNQKKLIKKEIKHDTIYFSDNEFSNSLEKLNKENTKTSK